MPIPEIKQMKNINRIFELAIVLFISLAYHSVSQGQFCSVVTNRPSTHLLVISQTLRNPVSAQFITFCDITNFLFGSGIGEYNVSASGWYTSMLSISSVITKFPCYNAIPLEVTLVMKTSRTPSKS